MNQDIKRRLKEWLKTDEGKEVQTWRLLTMLGGDLPKPTNETRIVHELCALAGMPQPWPEVEYTMENPFAAMSGLEQDTETKKITAKIKVSPAFLPVMGEDKTRATLAHEIGHLVNGDFMARLEFDKRQELKADDFARKLGFGRALAQALQDLATPENDNPEILASHPVDSLRIARLTQ
jgi:Zn-dependent protease with chaperone function